MAQVICTWHPLSSENVVSSRSTKWHILGIVSREFLLTSVGHSAQKDCHVQSSPTTKPAWLRNKHLILVTDQDKGQTEKADSLRLDLNTWPYVSKAASHGVGLGYA